MARYSDLSSHEAHSQRMQPVLARLGALGFSSSEGLLERVRGMAVRTEVAPAKTLLQTEDETLSRPRFLLSGWVCSYRQLTDGRRQIFDIILPGDGLGFRRKGVAVASAGTLALTPVEMVDASALFKPEQLKDLPDLLPYLEAVEEQQDRRRLDHLVRLGRLSALERLLHLMLEIHDRLSVIGQVEHGRFSLPLTQEMLADVLGLSVVHVNRNLQELRRRGCLTVASGVVALDRSAALATVADYRSEARPL